MLDFKTHSRFVFAGRLRLAVAKSHAYGLFLTRLIGAALEFLQPALDFSHSNPAFCHPISREKTCR